MTTYAPILERGVAKVRPRPPVGREARAERRAYLLRALASITRELLDLDRLDQRAPTIVEPTASELIPYDQHATRPARVRAWAADQGHTLNPRGRLPAAILEQYAATHPDDPQDPNP